MSPAFRYLLALATLALSFHNACAAPLPTGRWDGMIHVAGQNIPMQVTFASDSSGLHGKLDIQGQHGLALQSVSCTPPGPRVHFELAAMTGAIVCDGLWKGDSIAGDFTQAGFKGSFALVRGASPAAAPLPVGYRTEEVRIQSGAASLAGTLSLPEGAGPFPAMILITGSGAQDRDEEIFGFRPFRILAERLSRDGFAVLRLDDRGVGDSRGNFATATTDTFVTDVRAALDYLRARTEVIGARVGLCGHSEGALVAAMLASHAREVAFVILLAGPAVRGDSLLLLQGAAIGRASGTAEVDIQANADLQRAGFAALRSDTGWAALHGRIRSALLDDIRTRLRLPADSAAVVAGRAASAQVAMLRNPWMRRFVDLDPTPALEGTGCPVLALFGEFDTQVPPRPNRAAMQAAFARSGNRDATLVVLARANHLFQPTDDGNPSLYSGLPKEFAPGLLDAISHWAQERMGKDAGPGPAGRSQK